MSDSGVTLREGIGTVITFGTQLYHLDILLSSDPGTQW